MGRSGRRMLWVDTERGQGRPTFPTAARTESSAPPATETSSQDSRRKVPGRAHTPGCGLPGKPRRVPDRASFLFPYPIPGAPEPLDLPGSGSRPQARWPATGPCPSTCLACRRGPGRGQPGGPRASCRSAPPDTRAGSATAPVAPPAAALARHTLTSGRTYDTKEGLGALVPPPPPTPPFPSIPPPCEATKPKRGSRGGGSGSGSGSGGGHQHQRPGLRPSLGPPRRRQYRPHPAPPLTPFAPPRPCAPPTDRGTRPPLLALLRLRSRPQSRSWPRPPPCWQRYLL